MMYYFLSQPSFDLQEMFSSYLTYTIPSPYPIHMVIILRRYTKMNITDDNVNYNEKVEMSGILSC